MTELEIRAPKVAERLDGLVKSKAKAATLSTDQKSEILNALADSLLANQDAILRANQTDLEKLNDSEVNTAFRDRLTLNPQRIQGMAESLRAIARASDPVGATVETGSLQNGLKFRRIRAPLGVLLVIFESRPNVITEVFGLALKSGNCLCARGGKESIESARLIFRLIDRVLLSHGFTIEALPFYGIESTDRELVPLLLKRSDLFDVCIPRGGDQLIELVVREAKMPIIKNDRGLCHLYVHHDADLEMAVRILVNGKTQRPGVCNSLESLLVDHRLGDDQIKRLITAMIQLNVEVRGCTDTRRRFPDLQIQPALEQDFATEHLALILNVRLIDEGLEGALKHIAQFGSKHSEAIVTEDPATAKRFQNEVDAACVYWNASTRFTDGFTLGLGGEIGISTQKLHVRGPVGIQDLTSVRWIFDGSGQVRES